MGYYPMVGIMIGLILAGLSWILGLILPSDVVNALLIICMVVISGALHLDGFADTCDGIAGHKTPQERWEVMRDSRVGAFGVVGVCCLLLVKYVSLSSLPEPLLMSTLTLMPVISRWAMVYAGFAYPAAQPSGLGKAFKQKANWRMLTLATLVTLAVAAGLAQLAGLAIMAGIWIVVTAMGTYFKRKFCGLTGDTYGAINEVSEVCVILLISLLAYNQWV